MATPPRLLKEGERENLNSSRRKMILWGVQVAVALLITLILTGISFDYVESYFYDFRVRNRPSPKDSGHIEIIMIDSETIKRFKAVPGFKEHAQILNKIQTGQPKALVYIRAFAPLIDEFKEDHNRDSLLIGSKKDQQDFIRAAESLKNFYMQTDSMNRSDEQKKLGLAKPFDVLQVFAGPKTSDRNILARDGVTRRTLISYQNQLLMHPKLAALFNPAVEHPENIRGTRDIFDSQQVYTDYVKEGSFSQTKFEDVYDGKVDISKFKDKLILVGDDIGASALDYVSTPFSRDATMTLTELHANMFDTLIRNSAPVGIPKWVDYFLTFLIAMLTLSTCLSMRPTKGIFILLSTGVVFAALAWILFWLFGIWIEMSRPLLAVFACYYFFIPYRLIIENRRSWEYYQKHKLLQQVEEMKTNFISMISHDLKTPIARIQGMTDIIARDKVILSNPQQEAIDTIRSSSVDLLGTINSILNYAKIENQGVELHLQAKDINELLLEVIRRHEFLSKLKHIKITTELEPLFSISVDPELLKQVFSNLLENAIKYSPENSSIKVHSLEADGFITVNFIDSGFGIPEDELQQVFMKFFRSKNAKSSPIKGSGLGLYLAKYLIELHGGSIFVQSTPGKGSTFTVRLPLNN